MSPVMSSIVYNLAHVVFFGFCIIFFTIIMVENQRFC